VRKSQLREFPSLTFLLRLYPYKLEKYGLRTFLIVLQEQKSFYVIHYVWDKEQKFSIGEDKCCIDLNIW